MDGLEVAVTSARISTFFKGADTSDKEFLIAATKNVFIHNLRFKFVEVK